MSRDWDQANIGILFRWFQTEYKVFRSKNIYPAEFLQILQQFRVLSIQPITNPLRLEQTRKQWITNFAVIEKWFKDNTGKTWELLFGYNIHPSWKTEWLELPNHIDRFKGALNFEMGELRKLLNRLKGTCKCKGGGTDTEKYKQNQFKLYLYTAFLNVLKQYDEAWRPFYNSVNIPGEETPLTGLTDPYPTIFNQTLATLS